MRLFVFKANLGSQFWIIWHIFASKYSFLIDYTFLLQIGISLVAESFFDWFRTMMFVIILSCIFAEYSGFCAACLTLRVVLVCYHSLYLFHPSQSASVLSPPTCFTLFTNSPNCIALSVSVQLCYPTQNVLSPSVFLPPNLLFVLRRLQHSLVMFFFLRSHFRTSEGDQEKIGLRKPAVKGSSTRLLSRSQRSILKHSDLVRLCLRNKLLVVAHV